ncbi:hypothetical protein O4J56_10540 [Nocardiopsis sp. RSe5-2]|uniref:Uncharacterized protein n=1 Tax=Nocardiopsis endophytica TaxID=3018445 RepID=A0ABT4U298_9ACTN|nr:hypothetical protein [Nocardiopsis endophytica]MDA2811074.1 hypothetical protein [Nocardiopsis endophytica]
MAAHPCRSDRPFRAAEATEVLGGVWAGQLESVGVDVLARRVTLSIVVVDGSRPAGAEVSAHQVVFHDVSSFRWFDSVEGPWLRVEAAEIYAERVAGRHRVSVWLNDDDNQLVIDAAEVTLDGVAVLPRDPAAADPAPGGAPDPLPGALTGLWGGRFESVHLDLPSKRASLSLLVEPGDDDPDADLVPHLLILQEVSDLRLLSDGGRLHGEAFIDEIRGRADGDGYRFDFVFESTGDRLGVHCASALADFEEITL